MHLGEVARQLPARTAVVLEDRRVSYAALDAASRRIAKLARNYGLVRGSVLAVLAPNGPEFLAAVTAAQRSGLYALPLSTRSTAADLRYLLSDSGTELLMLDEELCGLVDAAQLGREGCAVVGFDEISGLFDTNNVPSEPDPVEGGDMLYTSGTTGKPKGVRKPLSFLPLGTETGRSKRLQSLFDFDSDSVFLSPAPLYHAAPLRFATTLLRLGATLILMRKFTAQKALTLLAEEKVTHSQWVPTMFRRLLDCEPAPRAAIAAPAHRCAIHAGAPCPVGLKQEMITWWGPILHEYYS
ncbi:MAG: AMP-binding protein, partial [Pseudomonadota bacterium]